MEELIKTNRQELTNEEDLEEYATITLFKSGDVYIKGELPEDVTEEIESILKEYVVRANAESVQE